MLRKKLLLVCISALFITSCSDDDEDTQPSKSAPTLVSINKILSDSTIDIVINPSGIAPLTAELKFNTTNSSKAEITVLGKESVNKIFEQQGSSHALPILGLYAGTANQVILKLTTESEYAVDTLIITTDSLPSSLPTITIESKNEAFMESGMNLNCLSISDGAAFRPYPLIYDKNGDIRWFLNMESLGYSLATPMERLPNGNLLFEKTTEIKEYDMMGREQVSIPVPAGYSSHHDVQKLPNGNYLVAVDKQSATVLQKGSNVQSFEDHILELNSSGQIITEWDLRELLDVDRDGLSTTPGGAINGDWFHMNAIHYSESDHSLIVSGQKQGVIKIDWNNNLKWILSPHKGWENAGSDGTGAATKPFLLTANNANGTAYDSLTQHGFQSASNFDWAWGQHAPLLMPNGNLLLFDNGLSRNFQSQSLGYSRAVEYKIDQSARTVEQIWQYGKERGSETYSSIISDVDYLPSSGNILFSPGIDFTDNSSKIVEVAYPAGMVVFEGTMFFKNERAVGMGFGEFDLTYRASRISLYP